MKRAIIEKGFISVVLLAIGAGCAYERPDRRHVFLDDIDDLQRFPQRDRERLQNEYRNLPGTVMVRVPEVNGQPRGNPQVRYFNGGLNLERADANYLEGEWQGGGVADHRIQMLHNMRHLAEGTPQHDYDNHRVGKSYYGGYGRYGYGRFGYKNHYHPKYSNSYSNYYGKSYYGNYTSSYYKTYYQPYYRSHISNNIYWNNYKYYNTYHNKPSGYYYYVYCQKRIFPTASSDYIHTSPFNNNYYY